MGVRSWNLRPDGLLDCAGGAERRSEVKFSIEDGPETSNAFANPVGFWVAVREAQVLPTLAVDVEACAGNVGNERSKRSGKHGGGVEVARQGHP